MANSAFTHDPQITVPASSTDNAVVIFDGTAGTGFGNSTIIVDSGGNGRIGIAADTNVITLTSGVVTIAGTVAATTLTGAGAGITALAAANITASGTLPALNGAALTALSAANITASGTLPALNGAALTALTAANITASGTLPVLNGSALTNLDADDLATGTVPVARLGDGNESNSTFLRGDNTWAAAGGGKVVQNVFVHQGQRITGTTTVPDDDTAPQNDEGVEMMTLAITPKATNNRLLINAQAMWSHSATGMMAMSLFQDSIAAALTTAVHRHSATNTLYSTTLFWEMAAGTTSATTFKIRMGSNASGNMNMNGTTGRLYGAILCSHITIMELEPNS